MPKPTDGARVQAIPHARYDAANNHVRNPIRTRLQCAADAKDDAPQHDGLAAANLLSDQEGDDGAKEASNLVDGDHGALQGRAAAGAGRGVDLGELRGEGMSGQEAGHDTLVIAETVRVSELAGVRGTLSNRTTADRRLDKAKTSTRLGWLTAENQLRLRP
jgi:hypothetical protein